MPTEVRCKQNICTTSFQSTTKLNNVYNTCSMIFAAEVWVTCDVTVSLPALLACHSVLECRSESWLVLEFSIIWHFLEPSSHPLFHQSMVSVKKYLKINAVSIVSNLTAELSLPNMRHNHNAHDSPCSHTCVNAGDSAVSRWSKI